MTKWLLLTLLIGISQVSPIFAHPHAFVECTLSFVMDKEGLVGFKQRWTLDTMTSVAVLDVVDTNRDGVLSAKEKMAVRDLSLESLLAYHYFTVARVNGEDFPVRTIADFSAELKDGQLSYNFLVPCRVKAAGKKPQEVKVAVYDDSFYTYVAYVEEGAAPIDPTKDPLFANKAAPARPEDFKRFSSAVGIGKFKGAIKILGDAAHFSITAKVKDASDMAYFYDQVIPQAFILSFESK